MDRHPIEQAISEQLKGFVPVDGIRNGGAGFTKSQLFEPRRSTEDILIEMADKMKDLNRRRPVKRRGRRNRRGPKVLTVAFF